DSPIIVILNKWAKKPFDIDRFAIQERYPSVSAFIETDCLTGYGLDELRNEISTIVGRMDSVREPFPVEWVETKTACSKMRKSYVPYEQFRVQCERRGVRDAADQQSLARILHRLGIVLHYADDPRLRDTTVLKPRWVTESIYTLLRLKEGPKSDGSMTLAAAC